MARHDKNKKNGGRATADILHGLRELAKAVQEGVPLEQTSNVLTFRRDKEEAHCTFPEFKKAAE